MGIDLPPQESLFVKDNRSQMDHDRLMDAYEKKKQTVVMAAFRNADFEILEHPPYSPDLANNSYPLHCLEYLKRQRYEDDDAVVVAVQEFLGAPDEVS
ncbi:hypothetical protein EVAR_99467_1 [Eumeta japonica]|uniref:Histone-lysine N-methyltransferase SETMAR n=1 Tax=Eumeta variegata TaxID=151549 RepID=A0A4C1Z740_EUMVA|nr:hypothetical protein EVAR_99467_1 [Eumeta japonica]